MILFFSFVLIAGTVVKSSIMTLGLMIRVSLWWQYQILFAFFRDESHAISRYNKGFIESFFRNFLLCFDPSELALTLLLFSMVKRCWGHSGSNGLSSWQHILLSLMNPSYVVVLTERHHLIMLTFDAALFFTVKHLSFFDHSLSTVVQPSALLMNWW